MNQYAFHESDFDMNDEIYDNQMEFEFDSLSKNESFARTVVAAFISQLNPTLEEIADVKTAVSEAVTNSIIHAYPKTKGRVKVICRIKDYSVEIEVIDEGIGIADVNLAMEPLYTTGADMERSGMGFAFMSAFMDELKVNSKVNQGTVVFMKKRIGNT